MKKSILLTLAIPMLLAGCNQTGGTIISSPKLDEETSQTGGDSEQGTGGSTTGGGTHSEGGHHTGGGTETGGESTTGGGTETGGGQTGGGTETGGQTETKTTTVSKNVGDFNLANGDKPQTLNVNEDISLSLNKGSNTSNPPAYYTSDDTLRFYPGNTLKVTSTKGSVTKIEFNYDGAGFSCSSGSLSNKVWTGSSSEITFTESGSKGNTKLYSIKITYGGTSGGGGGGTETGGGTVTTGDYTSTWPSNYQQYPLR